MGKLIRNGIEYGGGNGTDIFEVTQAEYNALKQAGTLVHNALYVITDAPNLNETAEQISYDGGTETVKEKIDEKADITALPFVKYEEINVALDNTGEGTLFTSNKLVVGIKDIPSDSLYVGYAVYYAGSQTKAKAFARNSLAFTSGSIISQTRKVGVYYLDNISVT